MKNAGIAVIALVIVAAAVTAGITVSVMNNNQNHDSPTEDQTFSITYDLDGGTATDLPTEYKPGTITELGCPVKTYTDSEGNEQEYYFLGWFTEKEYKNNVMYISEDTTGDVKLYAKWGEDVVGSGFVYDFERITEQTNLRQKYTTVVDGTYQYSYLLYDDDKGYYLNKVVTVNTQSGTPISSNTCNWSEEDEIEPTSTEEHYQLVLGNRTIDTTKIVLEYTGGSETQYLIYGWVPVKIEASNYTYYSNITSTYILDELFSHEFEDSYTITAYAENGITVTGDGEHARGESITLEAEAASGFEFDGWYDDSGALVSDKSTYTIDILLTNVVVYAKNKSTECDVTVDSGTSYTFTDGSLSDITWSLLDSDNNVLKTEKSDSFTYTFTDIGAYTVTSSGKDANDKTVNRITSVLSDGNCPKTYNWKYGDKDYSYTLNIKYSDYYRYLSDSTVTREQTTSDSEMRALITCNDKYVKELATYINQEMNGSTASDIVNMLLKFTQYIEYKSDTDTKGQEEYWKYPLETLFEQNGDCEDTSILFCAIGNAMGYDTALMLFSGHATGGINIEDLGYENKNVYIEQKSYFSKSYSYYIVENDEKVDIYYENEHSKGTVNDRFYFYCETTSTDFAVKEIPGSSYSRYYVLNVIPTEAST